MSFEPRGMSRTAGTAVTAPSGWRPPGWVVAVFGLAALLLVPWIVLLVVALPSEHRAAHWDIAWAGFDVALALLLLTVAVEVDPRIAAVARRRERAAHQSRALAPCSSLSRDDEFPSCGRSTGSGSKRRREPG